MCVHVHAHVPCVCTGVCTTPRVHSTLCKPSAACAQAGLRSRHMRPATLVYFVRFAWGDFVDSEEVAPASFESRHSAALACRPRLARTRPSPPSVSLRGRPPYLSHQQLHTHRTHTHRTHTVCIAYPAYALHAYCMGTGGGCVQGRPDHAELRQSDSGAAAGSDVRSSARPPTYLRPRPHGPPRGVPCGSGRPDTHTGRGWAAGLPLQRFGARVSQSWPPLSSTRPLFLRPRRCAAWSSCYAGCARCSAAPSTWSRRGSPWRVTCSTGRQRRAGWRGARAAAAPVSWGRMFRSVAWSKARPVRVPAPEVLLRPAAVRWLFGRRRGCLLKIQSGALKTHRAPLFPEKRESSRVLCPQSNTSAANSAAPAPCAVWALVVVLSGGAPAESLSGVRGAPELPHSPGPLCVVQQSGSVCGSGAS